MDRQPDFCQILRLMQNSLNPILWFFYFVADLNIRYFHCCNFVSELNVTNAWEHILFWLMKQAASCWYLQSSEIFNVSPVHTWFGNWMWYSFTAWMKLYPSGGLEVSHSENQILYTRLLDWCKLKSKSDDLSELGTFTPTSENGRYIH